jgi:hypothetical protein
MIRDGEIVGLESEEDARYCESHYVCVNHLDVVDLVNFKFMMPLVGEEEKVVIKVIKIWNGNETCHLSFFP